MGVATIDDDIALFEVWFQLLDEIINSRPCFDKEDNLAGPLEFSDQLLDSMRALNFCTCWRRDQSLST